MAVKSPWKPVTTAFLPDTTQPSSKVQSPQIHGQEGPLKQRIRETLAPAKSAQEAVTPNSVKGLMAIEAVGIGFLGYWLHSEYIYNQYFQAYFNAAVLQHLTTYAVLSGLTLGLMGSFLTVALWRNLRRAKLRLESFTPSRVRGSIEKARSPISSPDEHLTFPEAATATPLDSLDQPALVGVADEKK